ncbi:hypothetical protein SDC9_141118 [bioreactor metagenome]|uniref:Uncharacterized protein n=1 Tax=bioreactor metagenome TaxID=1076179 RepID=A0A645DXA4_9ZZZZ
MHPGQCHAQGVRVAHVVRGVPEVAEGQPAGVALVLPDRLQVGEDLAGVVLIGQRVDDRDPGVRRHLLDPLLPGGPPDDRGHVAAQHPGGVGDRLTAAHLGAGGVDDHRMAAELGDADLEGDPGAGRGLVEDHRDRTALERPAGGRVRLEGGGQIEDRGLLGRGEVVIGEEVMQGHVSLPAGSGVRRRTSRPPRR